MRRRVQSENGFPVFWNQKLLNGDFSQGTTGWTANASSITVANNIATIIPNSVELSNAGVRCEVTNSVNDRVYTSYMFRGHKLESKIIAYGLRLNGIPANDRYIYNNLFEWKHSADIFNLVTSTDTRYFLFLNKGAGTIDCDISNCMCINLTTMFGAGNEPSSVAEFEQWLQENGINPTGYIPYCAGETRLMTKPSWII